MKGGKKSIANRLSSTGSTKKWIKTFVTLIGTHVRFANDCTVHDLSCVLAAKPQNIAHWNKEALSCESIMKIDSELLINSQHNWNATLQRANGSFLPFFFFFLVLLWVFGVSSAPNQKPLPRKIAFFFLFSIRSFYRLILILQKRRKWKEPLHAPTMNWCVLSMWMTDWNWCCNRKA